MVTELSKLGEKTIEEFKNIKNLPTIPKVVLEVNEMLRTHNGDIVRLTEIIGKDQGLTTKILAVANSPLYGLPRNVSSLEFGIMLLGIGEISNIVTALSLASLVKDGYSEKFNFMQFWNHSMAVGIASKSLAKRLGFAEVAGDAFVAGMLHDVGIQLIAKYFSEQFEKIIDKTNNERKSFYDAEMEVLGITHEDIGSYMATKWNLPSNLVETLGYHHSSSLKKDNITLNIVHLADSMTQMYDIGNYIWDKKIIFDETTIKKLDFKNKSEFEEFIEEYFLVFQDAEDAIKL